MPQLEFSSTENIEFAIIRLRGQEKGGNPNRQWSDQKIAEGEYFFVINPFSVSGMRDLVEGAGAIYDALPENTQVVLDGNVEWMIPLGPARAFNTTLVSLRGVVNGETVWIAYESLSELYYEGSSLETRNKLEELGMYDSEGNYISSEQWHCPR